MVDTKRAMDSDPEKKSSEKKAKKAKKEKKKKEKKKERDDGDDGKKNALPNAQSSPPAAIHLETFPFTTQRHCPEHG